MNENILAVVILVVMESIINSIKALQAENAKLL